ncbi:hypothetical protein [Entomobacter blattae]|uniref:Uncharacterized protein n=1 Tax=Entomobacter blattae TaxID=2762277 RepID=A0A7H1NTQ8_9PROT|nr:hypothetical protein [Entomobacter blattae]QNT79168.1 hypothetical protein JGUZn3_19630 [Entomobacter blattae]
MKPSKTATTYLVAIMAALVSGNMDLIPTDISLYAALVVIVCNFIASHTKPPKEGSWLVWPYRVVNWFAGDFGWAENRVGSEVTKN